MKAKHVAFAMLIVASLLTPLMQPVLADLTGGGEVTNTAPVLKSITITFYNNSGVSEANYQQSAGTPTSTLNDDAGDYIEVNITVYDANGESDLTYINVSSSQTISDWTNNWLNHTVSATDRSNSSSPGFTENEIHGFDNGTQDNGYLSFLFKHTFDYADAPTNGALTSASYTITAYVYDSAGSSASDTYSFDVYNYANLTLTQGYFAPDGNQNTSDTMWGNWSGSSGSTQNSKNYLRAINKEATGTGNVTISWNAANLVNGSNTIPLTNINYFEGEAANPGAVASWGAVPADANHQNAWVTVTQSTSTLYSWSNYTINIPSVTPKGNYSQTFTWTIT